MRVKSGFRGSYAVTLTAPNGTRHVLKNARKSDHAAGLAATYRVNLRAASRNGTWTLRVTNAYGAITGSLDAWSLRL